MRHCQLADGHELEFGDLWIGLYLLFGRPEILAEVIPDVALLMPALRRAQRGASIEMGREVYTRPHSHQARDGLLRHINDTTIAQPCG